MSFAGINYLAVIVAAVAGFGVGALWYAVLFAKPWMAAMGITEAQIRESGGGSPMPFIISIVGNAVMAVVLSALVHSLAAATVFGGAVAGLLVWLGFVITVMGVNNAFGMRKPMVTVIDGGHWLAVLVVMGAVIGAFG